MVKAVVIPFLPFAAIAGGLLLLWHLPAALLLWITYRIPLRTGGGFFTTLSGFIVALLWIASYAWPFGVLYGASQL